ncbi:MAG: DUF1636 domain-containing protein [Natronohydrobacter sp.]|nr:DUF1636 domain-containing protein [Natronohydrobacter sp.]
MSDAPIDLLVCTRCRAMGASEEPSERPGAMLARRLRDLAPESVRICEVECLSNCSQGCTIALRGGDRWTYIYGRITAEGDLAEIFDGVHKYAASPDGIVPWRERPEHFRKNCIARIPPIEGFST